MVFINSSVSELDLRGNFHENTSEPRYGCEFEPYLKGYYNSGLFGNILNTKIIRESLHSALAGNRFPNIRLYQNFLFQFIFLTQMMTKMHSNKSKPLLCIQPAKASMFIFEIWVYIIYFHFQFFHSFH